MSEDIIIAFLKALDILEQKEYAKTLNRINWSFNWNKDKDITFSINSPKDDYLEAFASHFRDFFSKSFYNVENVYNHLKNKFSEYEEMKILLQNGYNDWKRNCEYIKPIFKYKEIRNKEKPINDNESEIEEIETEYTAYDMYEAYLYGFVLHKNPKNQKKVNDLWILIPEAKAIFVDYMRYGFLYLLFLKEIIKIAQDRKII